MFLFLKTINFVELKDSIDIARRILFHLPILLFFGASLIVGNKDIPFCHKQWAKLGKDMRDYRELCLNDGSTQIGKQCCQENETKNYFESRRISHKQVCFYEGAYVSA
jgi:hypothetical protein